MLRRIGLAAALAGATLGVAVGILYTRDMRAIAARLAAGSEMIETALGPVEVAVRGSGPPVLVIHGAGGGFDQGLLLADAMGAPEWRVIAVSRFGYLGSALPADASTAAQADVLAATLDALGVERAAVLAMSGGVPPALQLAQRHPQRVSGLMLLSAAPFTPLGTADQALPLPAWVYQALFASDLPYWGLQHLARPLLAGIFDAPASRRDAATPGERAFLDAMIDGFQPVHRRLDGLANEGAAIDPTAEYALETLSAPALVVHARDDGINPFPIGVHLAEGIPGADFRPLADGGHILLGHHAIVRGWCTEFVAEHAGAAGAG